MGLIKSIFGLIGGIFKALGGLVGLGNKSEFYMEIDEAAAGSQPARAASAPAPVKAEPTAKAEPLAAAPAPAKTASVKTAPAPAPIAVAAAPVPTGFASNYLTSVGTTMPSRRRPGPSLSPFRDMAKQVKTR
jgi:hypothetical protein